MRKLFPCLAVVALLLLAPSQSRADGFDSFTFTDVSADNSFSLVLTWQLPSNPTPDDAISGSGFDFLAVNVHEWLNGADMGIVSDSIAFLNPATNLGSWSFLDNFASLTSSSIMYTGDESNPTFIPGVYTGVDYFNSVGDLPNTATLNIVSTPEPSSILMLLAGFLVLAGAAAAKKAVA